MPRSMRESIRKDFTDKDDIVKKNAMGEKWLEHHPAPTWKLFARALYFRGENKALGELYYKAYISGKFIRKSSYIPVYIKSNKVSLVVKPVVPDTGVDKKCKSFHVSSVQHGRQCRENYNFFR